MNDKHGYAGILVVVLLIIGVVAFIAIALWVMEPTPEYRMCGTSGCKDIKIKGLQGAGTLYEIEGQSYPFVKMVNGYRLYYLDEESRPQETERHTSVHALANTVDELVVSGQILPAQINDTYHLLDCILECP